MFRLRDQLQITLEPIVKKEKVPLIDLCVNDSIQRIELSSLQIHDIVLPYRNNVISINFLNKHPKDTVVKDDRIVEDLAVMLQAVNFKNFQFHPYLKHISEYRKHTGELVEDTNGFMAFTGRLEIKIQTPLFITAKELSILKG